MAAAVRLVPVPSLLPALLPGESELARLVITAHDREVLSLRSRRVPDGDGWRHRLVDERDGRWHIRPVRTLRPLTQAQVIAVIDTAVREGDRFDGQDLARSVWAHLPSHAVRGAFVADSTRFPDLARHSARREADYRREWGLD